MHRFRFYFRVVIHVPRAVRVRFARGRLKFSLARSHRSVARAIFPLERYLPPLVSFLAAFAAHRTVTLCTFRRSFPFITVLRTLLCARRYDVSARHRERIPLGKQLRNNRYQLSSRQGPRDHQPDVDLAKRVCPDPRGYFAER